MIDVKKVASLARLKLGSGEEAQYLKNLTAVLEHFEKIADIPTVGVEPLVTPSDIEQNWRVDQAEVSLSVEEALANSPEREGNLFKVPPVV